jgi:magnesium chelatase subunit I
LLGLRGQAKTRIIRMLATLLDERLPYVAGCEIRDNPYQPICKRCQDLIEAQGDDTPIAWLTPHERYVEKLATPDVTIADMIGDIDPIKAARAGRDLSNELTVHYGLMPRANRGIFAINELPDLAGKIQVGLFNIMQEGDVQIKGYPVRLPLDILLVFTANPEDYTARGKIITPLKDRPRHRYPPGSSQLHPRDRGAAGIPGARRQEGGQTFRRFAAAPDFSAGKRRVQLREASLESR